MSLAEFRKRGRVDRDESGQDVQRLGDHQRQAARRDADDAAGVAVRAEHAESGDQSGRHSGRRPGVDSPLAVAGRRNRPGPGPEKAVEVTHGRHFVGGASSVLRGPEAWAV